MQEPAADLVSGASAPISADLAILGELNAGYVRAVAESDVAWFERYLTPDFLNTNPDGSLVDRAGFLRQIAKPIAIAGLRCEDVRIRVFAVR